jgi:hypothetical protein
MFFDVPSLTVTSLCLGLMSWFAVPVRMLEDCVDLKSMIFFLFFTECDGHVCEMGQE